MIYGNLQNGNGAQHVPVVIQRALQHLKETDVDALEYGVYEPSEEFLVQVIDHTTKPFDETRAEVHREKLDIHYSIAGNETIYVRVAPTRHELTEDRFDEHDAGFYDTVEDEVAIQMHPGDFVVLYPGEIHRPGCTTSTSTRIKKIVIKIRAADIA